jgi:hypothetical protein
MVAADKAASDWQTSVTPAEREKDFIETSRYVLLILS